MPFQRRHGSLGLRPEHGFPDEDAGEDDQRNGPYQTHGPQLPPEALEIVFRPGADHG
jgi:hypothetical protein